MKTHDWHHQEINEVLIFFKSNKECGLSSHEIDERITKYGKNELPEIKRRSIIFIFLSQFLSPLIYLLLLAATISFFIGEPKDSLVILIVLLINALIGSFQEGRAEKSLEALKKLSELKARVIRDGIEKIVNSNELVPGDILVLSAGDAIPSDARIIESNQLMTAEAALTGESLPVSKSAKIIDKDTLLADRSNMIYSGTYIHYGRCLAIVTSTGFDNEIGKIAKLASSNNHPKTRLESRIHRFGQLLIIFSTLISSLVILIGTLKGMPFAEIFMIAISQMVSLVPEGLPVSMTIALAIGVQRMAKKGAVIRKLSAVETLGSTTMICTDKTGTLTRNEMTVTNIYLPCGDRQISLTGVGYEPDGHFFEKDEMIIPHEDPILIQLLQAGILCNDALLIKPNDTNKGWNIIGDPTEAALLTLASKAHLDFQKVRKEFHRINEIPFNSNTKLMATQNQFNNESFVFIKGAPEIVIDYCNSILSYSQPKSTLFDSQESLFELTSLPYTEKIVSKINEAYQKMADSALRVLAFAVVKNIPIHSNGSFESFYKQGTLIGLVGQIDPPRMEVKKSINESQQAGIKTVMITGDHKATGIAIAQSLGIYQSHDLALDGKDIDQLSDSSFEKMIDRVTVFARVHPSQKLKIVETFQKKGHVVAMTGDGVNDAPALVKADVGVSMGITGTEVAKEASSVVITDDNFATIVSAVTEGRLVYQNIKKLILFLFVTSIDEVIILLLALLFGYPAPLAAVQILWINLVTEGTITINLVMEPPEGNEMKRNPVPASEPLLDNSLLLRVPTMVLSSVISTFGWFLFRTHEGLPTHLIQTETFTVLAVCQWFNLLNCRSSTQSAFSMDIFRNPWLIGGLFLGNVLQVAVVYWKPLNLFFHTVPIDPIHFLSIGLTASLVLWVEEIRKLFLRRIKNR